MGLFGRRSRWVDGCNLVLGLGFNKFIVYEKANGLLIFPSIGGL